MSIGRWVGGWMGGFIYISVMYKRLSVRGEHRLMKLMKQNKGRRSIKCLFTSEIYGRQLPTFFLNIIVLL
jgi:hypothetical protein